MHVGYRGWLRSGERPAVPFGFGLGYTTWRFDDLELASTATGGLAARVTVTNTGARRGSQTVQLYLSRADSEVERPARWLAGFARVTAEPGASARVELELGRSRFAHWSVPAHDWRIEAGSFGVHVGADVLDTPLAASWLLADDPQAGR